MNEMTTETPNADTAEICRIVVGCGVGLGAGGGGVGAGVGNSMEEQSSTRGFRASRAFAQLD